MRHLRGTNRRAEGNRESRDCDLIWQYSRLVGQENEVEN